MSLVTSAATRGEAGGQAGGQARGEAGGDPAVASDLELQPTACAICGTPGRADEVYPPTLAVDTFTPSIFSARRLPDRIHYRIVRCRSCGLVRSDPVLGAEALATLYESSTFDYGDELPGLRATYGRALASVARLIPERTGLLDIGAGNGFVLDVARADGWSDVRGVEPSRDAIARAVPETRARIVNDIMRGGLFEPETFNAVTLFQVLDHLPAPEAVLRECLQVLRPGGIVLAFNHNVAAWSAKVLGERSPIIDVEHTFLYSPATMRTLFSRAEFEVVSVEPVRNTYSLDYLTRLLPLPDRLKRSIHAALGAANLGRLSMTVPLGNLCLIARRPA